jgi:nucleotide-binding universal stress UspA family protein
MKILVPLDFSENSIKALEAAISLSKETETSILLVNVIELAFDFASQAELALTSLYADGEAQMEKIIKEYEGSKIPMQSIVLEGTAAVTLARIAEEESVDLIVMGTQGASGIKKTLIGTVTVNLVKESVCPVLIIPSQTNSEEIKKLTLALEFADHEEGFLDWVANLAKNWKLDLEILHIHSTMGFKEKLQVLGADLYFSEKFPSLNIEIKTSLDDTPSQGLHRFVGSEKNMILGMCHKHRTLWEQISKKSHSIEMAYHTHIPLLVIV